VVSALIFVICVRRHSVITAILEHNTYIVVSILVSVKCVRRLSVISVF